MSLCIHRPGLLTTVQDGGRTGYQRYGIVAGGAADPFAARLVNRLVGNDETAAVLEMAFIGPQLQLDRAVLLAWSGEDFLASIDGNPLPKNRPVHVPAGAVVDFGAARKGAMAWLAISGGIAVPPVMGSRSTYLAAAIGGHQGRRLDSDDLLPLGHPSAWAEKMLKLLKPCEGASWSAAPEWLPDRRPGGILRVMRGPEWDWFTAESQYDFLHTIYTLTKESNRMGGRFSGSPLHPTSPREMISSAVHHGVVQVPPSGQPIILGADRQTIGGYPRIGVVASVDFSGLAQLRPGDPVSFEEISTTQAHRLLRDRERDFRIITSHLSTPRP